MAQPKNQAFGQVLDQFQSGGAGGVGLNDTSFLNGVAADLTRPLFNAFTFAMHNLFLTTSVLTVIALVLLCFLPSIPLRGRGPGDAPVAAE